MTNQEIQEKLKSLSNQSAYPSVSILLPLENERTPTFVAPEHKLKVLVQETYQRLSNIEDEQALQTIRQKLDNIAENIKFDNGDKSMGIFVSPDHEEVIKLPFSVESNVFIGDNFQIRDLVQVRNQLNEYLVLMISEKKVLALRGSGPSLSVIQVPEMPASMAEQEVPGAALDTNEIEDAIDTSVEPDAPSPKGQADEDANSNQSSIQGVSYDEKQRPYLTKIDQALGKYLTQESLRVVLVGVDKKISHFLKFSKNENKVIGTVNGNYDYAPPQTISELVWPVVQNKMQEEKENLLSELQESVGRNLYVSGIDAVWKAAFEGRVRTLLIEENYQVRGLILDEGYSLSLDVPDTYNGPGRIAEDAVDDLIELVMSKAGNVVFVENGKLGDHQQLAAITRY
ncbi:hypothetical protein GXP67_23670 [Rhodocytophaga rosea]|uniref:Uncharacterized protein n=1 Tax=Rhodocytophaga rosea TaxID=2704465 RepID=A0A6C0GN15_9BACT|nr:hypothetical protein [Rhodocytophaga rosea]QHT69426.1 hypothetical protein GXP67_23670 [Rhodocytophaga rosea]